MPSPPTREPRVTRSAAAAAGHDHDSTAETSEYHDPMTLPTPASDSASVTSGVVSRPSYFDLRKCTFTATSRGTPLRDWITTLERAQIVDGWDPSTAVLRSLAHVSGPALTAVNNMLDSHPELHESWDAFKAALIEHFQPESTDWEIVQQIGSFRQTGTVAAYNAKATHLRSVMPRTIFGFPMEAILFGHYISNLRPDVRAQVFMTRPSSLEKAMHAATVYAQESRDGRPTFGRNKDRSSSSSSSSPRCSFCQLTGHTADNCYKRKFQSGKAQGRDH